MYVKRSTALGKNGTYLLILTLVLVLVLALVLAPVLFLISKSLLRLLVGAGIVAHFHLGRLHLHRSTANDNR